MKKKFGNFLLWFGAVLAVSWIGVIFLTGCGLFEDGFVSWFFQSRSLLLGCSIISVLVISGLFLASPRFNRQM